MVAKHRHRGGEQNLSDPHGRKFDDERKKKNRSEFGFWDFKRSCINA
jgi:hypothetical protein